MNTLFSHKRLEIHLLKEGKLGALECVVHCVTQDRKHLAVTIDMVDRHPLHLLPMIYRSRYTNFIILSRGNYVWCITYQKQFFLYLLEQGNDNKIRTRWLLWSLSVKQLIDRLQPKFQPNRNWTRLKILVIFWLSWFASKSSFKYRKRHFLEIPS